MDDLNLEIFREIFRQKEKHWIEPHLNWKIIRDYMIQGRFLSMTSTFFPNISKSSIRLLPFQY
jgi:hypothetical protein